MVKRYVSDTCELCGLYCDDLLVHLDDDCRRRSSTRHLGFRAKLDGTHAREALERADGITSVTAPRDVAPVASEAVDSEAFFARRPWWQRVLAALFGWIPQIGSPEWLGRPRQPAVVERVRAMRATRICEACGGQMDWPGPQPCSRCYFTRGDGSRPLPTSIPSGGQRVSR